MLCSYLVVEVDLAIKSWMKMRREVEKEERHLVEREKVVVGVGGVGGTEQNPSFTSCGVKPASVRRVRRAQAGASSERTRESLGPGCRSAPRCAAHHLKAVCCSWETITWSCETVGCCHAMTNGERVRCELETKARVRLADPQRCDRERVYQCADLLIAVPGPL